MWLLIPTGLVAVLAAILCFVPLFDILGYEFSFALTLGAVPSGLAVGYGAARGIDRASIALRRGATAAALHLLPALVLISANALRVRNCDFTEGLTFFAILPLTSALYASTLGVAVARIAPPSRFARVGIAVVLAGVPLIWTLWVLYAEPPIFAFDHLWGWFSGSLYDEGTRVDAPLWWFRLGTAIRIAAVAIILVAIERDTSRRRTGLIILAALVATGGFDVIVGSRTGYRIRRGDIDRALPTVVERPGLRIHLPADVDEETRTAIADDHTFRLAQLTARLGLTDDDAHPIIDSYVYASAADKARWMGGRGTMIAKPWLGELHVHDLSRRHPVVGHELVHVLAARFGSPPFGVSGHGPWVNLGLTEGLAEAVTAARGPLDVHHAARALRQQGGAPDIEALMSTTGFWTHSPRRAYTVAGSFVRYLLDTHGPAPLRAAYPYGDFETAYGMPLAGLAERWGRFVDAIELPPPGARQAREHFRRPSIFERPCAHVISDLRSRAHRASPEHAVEIHREICHHLGDTPSARLELAGALERAGEDEAFLALSDELLQPEHASGLTEVQRAGLLELRGMAAWKRGDLEAAREAFAAVLSTRPSLASERMQWVRLWALDGPPSLGATMRAFLAGEITPVQAVFELTELRASDLPDDRTIAYLIGRQLFQREAWDRAIQVLERAADHPFVPIEAERLRLVAEAHLELGQLEQARAALRGHLARVPASGARSRARDLLERIDWLAREGK